MLRGEPAGAEMMLASFRDFVLSHFEFEERWMLRTGYPEQAPHGEAHRDFADRLHRVTGEYRRQGPTAGVAEALQIWLEAWLRDHIGGDDRVLGRWATAHDAGQAAVH